MSLYQLARDGDADGLREMLQESEKEIVRKRAAEFLGDLAPHDQEVIDALVAAVEDDEPAVQAEAVDALTEIGPEATDALIEVFRDQAPDEDADWEAAELLTTHLQSDRPALRMASANALGRLGISDAAPALANALDDPNPHVRERVARACGTLDDPRTVDALTDRLHDDSLHVRVTAVDSLGTLQTPTALRGLLAVVDDPSPKVRWAAVSELGGFGEINTKRPLDAIVTALSDDDKRVRETAVFAIVELLSNAPSDDIHDLRQTVVKRLDTDERGHIVTLLVEILTDSEGVAQRRNAVWLLGRLTRERGREQAVDALTEALRDGDDEKVVQFAATSLVGLGGEDAAAASLEVLTDPEASTTPRSKAASVLGHIGGKATRDRLLGLVDDIRDQTVRKHVFAALSQLEDETA